MLLLYTVTLFVSATLLFVVQPMFAKMALPLLGGTPNVWNTCMVFYQAALLGGYLYAHFAMRVLGSRRQAVLHLSILALPWVVLPIGVAHGWTPPADANPVPWLLMLLALSVGLPFFVVSASAPMLQAWFSETGHPSAKDPYFLYAASNLGSIIAMVGYPLVLEPLLTLRGQSLSWTIGYGLLCVLTLACGVTLWRSRGQATASQTDDSASGTAALPPTLGLRLRWLGLSLAPSSLLLGVTTFISTDIGSVPLLWVIPFILYLLTFVIVFGRWGSRIHSWVLRLQPFVVIVLVVCFFINDTRVNWPLLPLHLGAFFVMALACHGELAAHRPAARYLTEFYMWMSVGGVLGGMFNAILAPVVFRSVIEYPLMLVVVCLLRPAVPQAAPSKRRVPAAVVDVLAPAVLAVLLYGLVQLLKYSGLTSHLASWLKSSSIRQWLSDPCVSLNITLVLAIALLASLSFVNRPVRFGLGVAVALILGHLFMPSWGEVLHTERNFFGVIRVRFDKDENRNVLIHGSINHGTQSHDPALRATAISYYHRTGPLGQAIDAMENVWPARKIAVIGLGTGTIAAYGDKNRSITFYEIDPAVRDVAENPAYFTYLSDSRKRGAKVDVVLGDARLMLARAPDQCYNLIVLDAYSSDAIPIHLVTREAIKLYVEKLDRDGVIALHISNRFFNLEPVLGRLAEDQKLAARVQEDDVVSLDEQAEGKLSSHWVVMARREDVLGEMATDSRWRKLGASPDAPLWTDDYSNIISVLSCWE
jgi:spermidine synthase